MLEYLHKTSAMPAPVQLCPSSMVQASYFTRIPEHVFQQESRHRYLGNRKQVALHESCFVDMATRTAGKLSH